MGNPAARQGDLTAHGGTISIGCPTVQIGGQPAARIGDMHTCPMQTPGTPPIPHVGGPIIGPGVPTVLIGNMPAAVVGDSCTCVGPPDTIAPPGCPTVLIGTGGGGGGGGGAAQGGSPKGAGTSAEVKPEELHDLNVAFTDKGGFPISGVGYTVKDPDSNLSDGILAGRVQRTGKEGSYEITLRAITSAKWSTAAAEVGEKVKMTADTVGIPGGEKAKLQVFIRDGNFADRLFESIAAEVKSDKIEAEWELRIDDKLLKDQDEKKQKNYSSPSFYFQVEAAGLRQRSGYLKYKDWLEIKGKSADGKPMAGAAYTARFPDGSVRSGKLDDNGYVKLENVPPGKAEVVIDPRKRSK